MFWDWIACKLIVCDFLFEFYVWLSMPTESPKKVRKIGKNR